MTVQNYIKLKQFFKKTYEILESMIACQRTKQDAKIKY